jgi:hypothetical protein
MASTAFLLSQETASMTSLAPAGGMGRLVKLRHFALVQERLPPQEVAIALHRIVMSEGNLVRFLFDDPMSLHVCNVERRNVGELGHEGLEGRELILQDGAVLDRADREHARLFKQRGADRGGDAVLRKEVLDHHVALWSDIVLREQALDNECERRGYRAGQNERLILAILSRAQEGCPGMLRSLREIGIRPDVFEERVCGHRGHDRHLRPSR